MDIIIKTVGVTKVFNPHMPNEVKAVRDASIEIEKRRGGRLKRTKRVRQDNPFEPDWLYVTAD